MSTPVQIPTTLWELACLRRHWIRRSYFTDSTGLFAGKLKTIQRRTSDTPPNVAEKAAEQTQKFESGCLFVNEFALAAIS
jgi:hypothetical protein